MFNFIEKNKNFWSHLIYNDSNEKILIEEPSIAVNIHANAVFALILNQAKGYNPVWLYGEKFKNTELLKSYNKNSTTEIIPKKSLKQKIYIIIVSIIKFIKVYIKKDILKIYYDGVKYGDIIYDTYLIKNSVATIEKIDFKLIKYIIQCISRHLEIKNILQSKNYKAVLVSHQVGIKSGVMLRVALRYGLEGYLGNGYHQASFQCFRKVNEVYEYRNKPTKEDIEEIINKLGTDLEEKFLKNSREAIAGEKNRDGLNAFSKKNNYYTDRAIFNKEYKIDPTKKNIFVMLHAFNDYPHSHFRWMIFKDYYDWFFQTLEFAKKQDNVNWIFKQHPSIKYYPMKNINMKKLFTNCADNIYYIDEDKQIDTRSLVYCADVVITCLGSAGFELPAMGAIPAITAGDNFYTGLDFAIEPINKKEYFDILKDADKINKLTPEIQKRAKAAYIHIYDISTVSFTAYPKLSLSEEKDKNIDNWYWTKVINQYEKEKDKILQETNTYIKATKDSEFKQLFKEIMK